MARPKTNTLAVSPPATLADSLAAVATELERVAVRVNHLQTTLSPLLHLSAEAMEDGQALDEITQQVCGLAEFLGAIALDCPAKWRLDVGPAAGRLGLHAQKLRLTSSALALPEGAAPVASASGELELW